MIANDMTARQGDGSGNLPGTEEPEYLDAARLAKKLSVSVKAIQKWTGQHRIPCTKVGYRWRYPSNEINKRLLSGQLLSPMVKGRR
jgi:hypothetical protein